MIEEKNLFEEYEKVISKIAVLKSKIHLSHMDQKEIKRLHTKKTELRKKIIVGGSEEIVGYLSIKNNKLASDSEENFNHFPSQDGDYGIIRIK